MCMRGVINTGLAEGRRWQQDLTSDARGMHLGTHGSKQPAQRKHPTWGRSTPKPAQQHPQPKVGGPPRAQHSPAVPKQPLGSSLCRFAVSVPPLGLISAHLLWLIAMRQT